MPHARSSAVHESASSLKLDVVIVLGLMVFPGGISFAHSLRSLRFVCVKERATECDSTRRRESVSTGGGHYEPDVYGDRRLDGHADLWHNDLRTNDPS